MFKIVGCCHSHHFRPACSTGAMLGNESLIASKRMEESGHAVRLYRPHFSYRNAPRPQLSRETGNPRFSVAPLPSSTVGPGKSARSEPGNRTSDRWLLPATRDGSKSPKPGFLIHPALRQGTTPVKSTFSQLPVAHTACTEMTCHFNLLFNSLHVSEISVSAFSLHSPSAPMKKPVQRTPPNPGPSWT